MTKAKIETRFSKTTPKVDQKCHVPDDEDFAAWCDHPVTIFVATALKNLSEQMKLDWLAASWEGNNVDPVVLAQLRAYSIAFESFSLDAKDTYVPYIK